MGYSRVWTVQDLGRLKQTIHRGERLDRWRVWQLSKGLLRLRAKVACMVMRHPARSLNIVGVTGTDGKTTTTELTAALLATSGRRVSLINSLGASIVGLRVEPTWKLTTPGPFVLQGLLRWMKRCHSEWVIVEASSHGLAQWRLGGVGFRIAVMTNVTPEHLDYHRDMAGYAAAKAVLIRNVISRRGTEGVTVLNRDDPSYPRFRRDAAGICVNYGLGGEADVRASSIDLDGERSTFEVATPTDRFRVALALPGLFNVYNAMAACAVGYSQGVDQTVMAEGLSSVTRITGRMSPIIEGQSYSVVIDYAHTPNALEQVLRFYRPRVKGRIILVFGCSGERDPGNRSAMGAIAGLLADYVVITRADNRSESIHAINRAIAAGLDRAGRHEQVEYAILPDRREAIQHACDMANAGDLVLITGKGHETLLNIDGNEMPWNDCEVASMAITRTLGRALYSRNM